MNYYEHHIGDYAEATAHLTFVEDAAYSRLIRKYYATERPMPADTKAVQRLVGARTKEERAAVDSVLSEFFVLEADGWHQLRCDEEIKRYQSGEPEREVKKANEENRLRRHREERAALFQVLTDAGQHAAWNIGINELRTLAKSLQPPLPATAPATLATATQSPVPRHQTPDTKEVERESTRKRAPTVERPEEVSEQVWADWLQLRKAKRAAVTETVLSEAAREAVKAGLTLDRFLSVWCVRGSQGLQADWLKPSERGAPPHTGETTYQRSMRERMQEAVPGVAARAPAATQTRELEAIDVAARRLD